MQIKEIPDLSLRLVHMPFCWFCHEAAHWIYFSRTWLNLPQNELSIVTSINHKGSDSCLWLACVSLQSCQSHPFSYTQCMELGEALEKEAQDRALLESCMCPFEG